MTAKFTLTIVADTAAELMNLVGELATSDGPREAPAAAEAPRRRGRPAKAETAPEAPVAPSEPETPAPTPAEKVAARIAAVSAEATKGDAIDKPTVRKKLIEVVQKIGKDACGSLCLAHGGPNLSVLDPAVYPALYADACKLLEGQDPAA